MIKYMLTVPLLVALWGCHTGEGMGGHRAIDSGASVRSTSTQYPQVGDHTIVSHPDLSEAVSHQGPDAAGPGATVAGTHRGAFPAPRPEDSAERAITLSVNDALISAGMPSTALNNIRVRTHRGEVYLTGHVLTEAEKDFVEQTARQLPGVREVHNHLRVNPR
jgi:hypothetical protein